MWAKLASLKKGLDTAKKAKETAESISGGKIDTGKIAGISAAIVSSGCLLGVLIIVCVFAIIILTPLFYINDRLGRLRSGFETFTESLHNFVTFRGWCTNDVCAENERAEFYDTIEALSDKYGARLNTNLLVATLTYTNPSDYIDDDEAIEDDEDLSEIEDFDDLTSQLTDYRKSRSRAKKLAKKLVKDYDNYRKDISDGNSNADIKDYYYDDLEDYIRKYYFQNVKSPETDMHVRSVIEEIYERIEFFEYVTANRNNAYKSLSGIKVVITSCDGNIALDTVSLYDYVKGLLYTEGAVTINYENEEFLKAHAIAAKTYLFRRSGAKPDDVPKQLRISSCELAQIFCSVDEGCYLTDLGSKEYNGKVYMTVAPGVGPDGTYANPPITDQKILDVIDRVMEETFNLFIVDGNSFVSAEYRSSCDSESYCNKNTNRMDQARAIRMDKEGKSYREILDTFYTGEITQINLSSGTGYPLDEEYDTVTSPYGWRVHPVYGGCRLHTGADFPVACEKNIYAVADGVVVETRVEGQTTNGNYIAIGHGNEINGSYEYYTAYSHMVRPTTYKVGDVVYAGDLIGYIGTTGTSTGCHLHLEYFSMSGGLRTYLDPLRNLSLNNVLVQSSNYYSTKEACCNANKGVCGG